MKRMICLSKAAEGHEISCEMIKHDLVLLLKEPVNQTEEQITILVHSNNVHAIYIGLSILFPHPLAST